MTPYEQLLARLLPARRFGVVLGLERMHAIFERLGHPERRLGRVVHVGGTNGKGSTVAMIARLLGVRGESVATYTSPHLSCLRERICFDGEMIGEDAIVRAADRVSLVGGDELTFFEQLTAIACVAIAERGVDFTVLEVGLGGRLDATNAISADVAVVTGVAMDHAAILGDTLEAIAIEKAGIFKPGQRVVIGGSGEWAAVPVLIAAAKRAGASSIRIVDDTTIEALSSGARVRYQRANVAAANIALDELDATIGREPLSIHRRLHAIAGFRNPGRFEVIEGSPAIILDGAHNPHAATALAAEVRQLQPTIIVAVSADKDARGIAAALKPVANHVIVTRYQQDRALPPEQLAAMFDGVAETAPDLASALARARSLGAPILITGSLFLVGEARVLLLGAPADPYVVTDPPAR